MAKDPAFLFYPNDYIGGTMGMTFEEKGAYMELLMMQFNRGHMTSHMIGQTVGQLWDKLQDKFVKDEKGLWYNVRLDEEKEKRKAYTNSRKKNKSGNNQYTKKPQQKRGHMIGHMEDVDENINLINSVYKTFVDEIKKGEHSMWSEETYMKLKIRKGTLTNLLTDFKRDLIINNMAHKTTLDLRKHFNNWLNKQEQIGKLEDYKLKRKIGV